MAQSKVPQVSEADIGKMEAFVRGVVADAGAKGVVIGLSGGLDSAIVTKICADAIGAEKVLNIFMPCGTTPGGDYDATEALSDLWGTEYLCLDIQPAVDALSAVLPDGQSNLDRGNVAARCRMAVLFNYARVRGYLVVGTSNRSEMMTGYFTKFGDNACDMQLISGYYKTQVRELARMAGVPEDIVSKPPSAGFWEGQTDEDEIGMPYSDLDSILVCIEEGMDEAEVSSVTGIPAEKVGRIFSMVRSTGHKRSPPLHP